MPVYLFLECLTCRQVTLINQKLPFPLLAPSEIAQVPCPYFAAVARAWFPCPNLLLSEGRIWEPEEAQRAAVRLSSPFLQGMAWEPRCVWIERGLWNQVHLSLARLLRPGSSCTFVWKGQPGPAQGPRNASPSPRDTCGLLSTDWPADPSPLVATQHLVLYLLTANLTVCPQVLPADSSPPLI